MEGNYTTAQTPDKGVQVGPEPIPAPDAILATTQDSIPGFGGNLIEAGIVIKGNKRAVYKSKAYPSNADGKRRPGATVEYSSEFSVGEGIGGIPELPWGYIRAEFLESTGTQYILTNQLWNGTTVSYKVAAQGGAGSPSWYNNRTGSTEKGTYGGIYQQNAGGLYAGYKSSRNFVGGNELYPFVATLSTEYGYAEVQTDLQTYKKTYEPWYPVDDVPVALFAVSFLNTSDINYSRNSKIQRIFWFKVSKANIPQFSYIPVVDKSGVPCMFDKVSKHPIYNSGDGAFIVGFTLEQALQLSKLPKTGGSLTISLPWEAQLVQYNAKVEEALQTAKNNGWTITVQYRDPEADSAIYNKYARCKTYADMVAVNPDFANDLTNEGEWIYPLPEVERIGALDNPRWLDGWWTYSPIKKAVMTLPKATYSVCLFTHNHSIEQAEINLPVSTHINRIFQNTTAVKHPKVYAPNTLSAAYVFGAGTFSYAIETIELYAPKTADITCLASYRSSLVEARGEFGAEVTTMTAAFKACFALKVFPTNYPKLKTANEAFDRVQMSGQQAIDILTSIPTWTDGAAHPITMGIHIDYENDADVLAAIENATAKGWTVTTQWTGTPTNTASTFGLKRVWVRKREDEQGEYEAQDGTRWQIEWCDMLSAPDGSTPEDHGYELFQSVEVAAEHWDLTPWVASEQEEEFIQEI